MTQHPVSQPYSSRRDSIIDRLDAFIRKYYKNQLLKGFLYAAALLLVLFLLLVVLEHFSWFGVAVRTILFWLFLTAVVLIVGFYVVRPLLKMYRLGSRISYQEAAQIIGAHFPEVKDKLLNLLQLQEMQALEDGVSDGDGEVEQQTSLLAASIEQKTIQLSPIPFLGAIDLRKNWRYVKYVALPLIVIVAFLLVSPSFITEPSKRLINHSTYYERPAPFSFVLENSELSASQQEDFQVRMLVDGEEIPSEAFIIVDGHTFKMQQRDRTHYSYLFKNLQQGHRFSFTAVGVTSEEYELEVLPKPIIVDFQASVSYPAYTRREPETFSNEGDITIPKGSMVTWRFLTRDVDSIAFATDLQNRTLNIGQNGRAQVALRAMASFSYAFSAYNNYGISDTLSYSVSVIDDAYPMIAVIRMEDSTLIDRFFFKGQIKDDYGFSKMDFVVVKTNVSDTSVHIHYVLPVSIGSDASQEFFYSADLSQYAVNPGDHIQYYFEVWDNDGVNGNKSSKSQSFEIQVPTEEEIDQFLEQGNREVSRQAESSISELQRLQEEINEMMRKLVDKKELTWQDKKQLEELKNRHEEVMEMLQEMQQQIRDNNRMEEKYREQNEQIMEKQRELDRLFDQVMNDEIKEMMRQMEQMMNEIDKKKVQEELEQMKLNNEDLEKQIDQNIELLRRLELEKQVDQAVKKAEELARKQEELSDRNDDAKQQQREQQLLNEEFQQLKRDIDKIQQGYKDLDNPADFKVDRQLEQSIEQNQNQAQEKLGRGKQKEASKSQKQAAEELQQLSEQLAEAQMDVEQSDLAEDSETVRRLLKNLVQLSFNQEELISMVSSVSIQDPRYQNIISEQNKLKADFRNVDDSLQAMAKRQLAVATVINKEVADVKTHIAKSLSGLLQYNQTFYGSSRNPSAARSMQYSMTALNNLSLILAESLDQMQNQMRQNQQQKQNGSCKRQGMKMKGGNCSKPGNGKPSPKSMRQMQEELNKQMQALKQQLEKQGGKPGGRTQIGKGNKLSSEFARMAAQQEQIRRMMQEYGQEMKQQSGGNAKLAQEIDQLMRQMEQTETDLVNKTITQQTIKRQQQIMTRLLQHEKAEMQREKEERRESTEGKDIYQPSQSDLERYNQLKERNMELFHTTPPALSNYYKNKVNEYFFKFD